MQLSAESTSRFVQAGDVRIHYHEAGEGPVLLAIHGGAPGAYGWGNFGQNLAALSQHFRVVIVDLPGYGKSDKPAIATGRYGFYADVFENMLTALGIDRCHIVGLATGGAAGLMMALRRPELIERLIVVAPPVGPSLFAAAPTEGAKHIMGYYGGTGPSREKMQRYLETIIFDKSRITDELIDDRHRVSIDPDFMATAHEGHARSTPVEPIWQRLSEVETETLIIWGRENRVIGFDVGLFMLAQMKRAQLNVYGRTGLWAPWEQTARFNRDVIGFLSADI
ncbi:alpha/beta fold hydrolase [Sphingoaurantiacus capsulatus]|uniref:Alpha/beta fold hydrolase n=1 Tax=Sphingoaurantiacus capsulatus TaxID=1771310 RepID=A0ABV7X680_9SPHN